MRKDFYNPITIFLMKKNLLLIIFACTCVCVSAKQAYPGLLTKQMPDGSVVEYRLHGDENFHYMTLADGTLIKQEADGFFYYAMASDKGVVSTAVKVGDVKKYDKAMRVSAESQKIGLESLRAKAVEKRLSLMPIAKSSVVNAKRGLAIMVEFPNMKFKYSQQLFNDMLNKEGFSDYGSTGSALDYFKNSSYGKYAPKFDVFGPYTVANNYEYYGETSDDAHVPDLIVEACKLAEKDGKDLSIYDENGDGYIDNVFVFYAGEGEANGGGVNTIWPHRWVVRPIDSGTTYPNYNGTMADTKVSGVYVRDYACGNEICKANIQLINNDFEGVGTFVHEFGHVLGLMDLYDTSSGYTQTLDVYDVMDHGDYLNMGRTPAAYSAYERMCCGWLTPKQVHPTTGGTVYTLHVIDKGEALLLTADGTKHNLDGQNPNPEVFYLIENRSGKGWDKYMDPSGGTNGLYDLPGDKGLLITKITYNKDSWQSNLVNAYGNQGVGFIYTMNQQYPYFYPMFPGKLGITSTATGPFKFFDIVRDEETGDVTFTVSDRNGPEGGVEGIVNDDMVAVGLKGSISMRGSHSAEIYNSQGVLVYSGAETTIKVAAGIYIVRMYGIGGSKVEKVVVR